MPKTISANGPALLRFPDGGEINVDARLTVNRTFFSITGEGEFITDSETASRAFLSGDPLSLTIDDSAMAFITVHETKTTLSTARCWFVRHSGPRSGSLRASSTGMCSKGGR